MKRYNTDIASQQTMHAHVPMVIGEYYEVM